MSDMTTTQDARPSVLDAARRVQQHDARVDLDDFETAICINLVLEKMEAAHGRRRFTTEDARALRVIANATREIGPANRGLPTQVVTSDEVPKSDMIGRLIDTLNGAAAN